MAAPQHDEKSIFLQAIEIGPSEERAAFLDAACGSDKTLRSAVEALLCAHEKAQGLLDVSCPAALTTDEATAVRPGFMIGPYKLIQEIGEGGMGTVFMAQQTEPVKRLVAVKLIKAGMDSKQVLARFEAERQALALMDHPNIAKVHDAGTTPDGRPFFVMELVKGLSITKYCDQHRLTPRERLELFGPVCQAVQHAHQKGIIHRDLKPSNVLIALYDGKPVPKVIDFGIAKAAGQPLTDRTLVTGFGTIVGTLEYMSPEQAEFNALDIDTRSDIYSLGVMLYELLTGSTPLTKQRLQQAAMAEMLRMIREDEPPRPSTRLSESKESLASISAQRHMEPAKLTKLVRGELDWIVMKALEKDRNRRYETANGFAADVQRYLADEPVQACPPSAAYRLRKFVRRNRGPVLAAATFLAMLLSSLALALHSNSQINQALADRTTAFRQLEIEQRNTEEARRAAEQKTEEIRDGLEKLNAANFFLERGRIYLRGGYSPYVVTPVPLSRAGAVGADFDRAVELRSDHSMARDARGQFLASLGLWEDAASDLERAYALSPPTNLPLHGFSHDVWFRFACLRAMVGDGAGYRAVCDRMANHAGRPLTRGPADGWMAWTYILMPGATDDTGRAVEAAKVGITHFATNTWALRHLGFAYYRAGEYAAAVEALEKANRVAAVNDDVKLLWLGLALSRWGLGDAVEAEKWLTMTDGWLDTQMTPPDPEQFVLPLPSWQEWATFTLLYREAARTLRPGAASDHPLFHVVQARGYAAIGRRERAVKTLERAARLRPRDQAVRFESFRCYTEWGRWAEAAAEHTELVRLQPADHALRLRCGDRYAELGRWKEAAADYAAALEVRPHDDPMYWFQHAFLYLKTGDAAGYHRHCEHMLRHFGPDLSDVPLVYAAHTCVLAPGTLGDAAQVVRIAEKRLALKGQHPGDVDWAQHILALAHYRAGEYDAAARELAGAGAAGPQVVLNDLVRAMTYHRQARAKEAQEAYDRATTKITQDAAAVPKQPARFAPPGWRWRDWLAVQLLHAEAKVLFRAGP